MCLLEERGVPGCWAVAWCSPDPRVRGSTLLLGSTAVQVGWEVRMAGEGFNLLHARMGGSRKEKTTESRNAARQEAFQEVAHTGAVS